MDLNPFLGKQIADRNLAPFLTVGRPNSWEGDLSPDEEQRCAQATCNLTSMTTNGDVTMSDRPATKGYPSNTRGSGGISDVSHSSERVARIKEERRKELAQKFNNNSQLPTSKRFLTRPKSISDEVPSKSPVDLSSTSSAVRTTRASRLRAGLSDSSSRGPSASNITSKFLSGPGRNQSARDLATQQQQQRSSPKEINGSHSTFTGKNKRYSPFESNSSRKLTSNSISEKITITNSSASNSSVDAKREKDKSSKRKSNLNRSLTAEATPPEPHLTGDQQTRRRRRCPDGLLSHSDGAGVSSASGVSRTFSEASLSRGTTRQPAEEVNHAGGNTSSSSCGDRGPSVRKTSTAHPTKRFGLNGIGNVTPRPRTTITNGTTLTKPVPATRAPPKPSARSMSSPRITKSGTPEISSPSLSSGEPEARTHSPPSQVENLSDKTRDKVSPMIRKISPNGTTDLPASLPSNDNDQNTSPPILPRPTGSILKKKSLEENPCITPPPCTTQPVSILKRKTSHEDPTMPSAVHPPPPPVTFSPTVTDHIREGARTQGILKKRRSLDESEVLRRRSCSPDLSDYKPILKPQRRSSLEELVRRAYSPEPQSILKRKSSRDEEGEEHRSSGSPEPQGILKRKSTSSQSSLDNNSPHVSIIPYLSSATGSLDSGEYSDAEVKPILKKKSSFDETITTESWSSDGPRPILKKKTSCDSDLEYDDRPMKPILKTCRKSSNEDSLGINVETSPSRFLSIRNNESTHSDLELRPSILKQPERSRSPRSRLSFERSPSPSQSMDGVVRRRPVVLARSHSDAIDSELIAILSKRRSIELGETPSLSVDLSDTCRAISPVRRGAVAERVTFLEQDAASAGAVPRRMRANRNNERFRTQPITLEEITDSERVVKESLLHHSTEPTHLNSPSRSPRFSIGEKMTSNDGDNLSSNISTRNPLFLQELKCTTTESASRRLHSRQDKARFATHPVTLSEVEEAVKTGRRYQNSEQEVVESATTTTSTADDGDPCKLSLAERVRLFNQKSQPPSETTPAPAPTAAHRKARFRTQPVTNEEMAQVISPLAATLVKPPDPESLGNLSIHAAREKIYENAYSMLSRTASFGGRSGSSSISPRINGEKINPKGILKKENDLKKSLEIDSDSEEELRGILKSPPPGTYSAASNSPELESFKHLKSVLKKETETNQKTQSIYRDNEKHKRSILKSSRSSTFDDDTSSGESISNDDLENEVPKSNNLAEMLLQETNKSNQLNNNHSNNLNVIAIAQRNARNVSNRRSIGESLEAELKARMEQKTTPPTSDGETSSSGGREIQRIIGNEAVARRRQIALSKQNQQLNRCPLVSKSQSHSSVRQQFKAASANVEVEINEDSWSLGLRRSQTQPLAPETETMSGVSIAERRAALQENGQTGWRKRIPKLKPEDERSTTNFIQELAARRTEEVDNANSTPAADPPAPIGSILAERLNKLETSSNDWKKRVHQSDAEKFSVAGKMKMDEAASGDVRRPLERTPSLNKSPLLEIIGNDKYKKRTPKPVPFRSKAVHYPDVSSSPSSPNSVGSSPFKRSFSAPGDGESDESPVVSPTVESPSEEPLPGRMVSVPRADDETFTSFYSQEIAIHHSVTTLEVDLDAIEAHTPLSTGILRERARFQAGRRAPKMRNPIRALANRLELQTEYLETTTGFAEKELKRYKMEQLVKHNKPHIAMEALAGLASKEDFKAVNLRKTGVQQISDLSPYKDLMLLHVKGRRHVQTRLVEPIASSINQGDCYVLVTPKQVYLWIGKYANVIERSRGAEVSQHIVQHRDLGCNGANQVITLSADKPCSPGHLNAFWKLLNHDSSMDVKENGAAKPAGLSDEDELYETLLIETNKVYELNEEEELVPVESAWGVIPKYELLNPSKILVFDFGSEMYIWQGSQVSSEMRRMGIRLARELWSEGYNYSECSISPLSVALLLGQRAPDQSVKVSATERPSWAILAKINQHMETILFREKFLDWPDFSRVIKIKEEEKQTESYIEMKPCDPKSMYENEVGEPDLELEGTHLGRGHRYYDEETHRHFEISSKGIQVWHINEYDYTELPEGSIGQFHEEDSYIIRWQYSVSVTGRELSGLPSKHNMIGRERCAYFCWQGLASPQCEKGAAALLTVELDRERGPQIRVVQNAEPPTFLRLFNGKMVVHFGRRGHPRKEIWRLYICRGEMSEEAVLVQVPCNARSLRSRASFVLLNTKSGQIFCWNGSKAPSHTRKIIRSAIDYLRKKPQEVGFAEGCPVKVSEQEEGSESSAFFEGLGGANRHLYISLKDREEAFSSTLRLYHLSSLSGTFSFAELAGPYRATLDDHCTAFPFTQNDLYSASQPALFLLDVGHELWLWQGWWPDHPDDEAGTVENNSQLIGSGAIRWQAERKEAMRTALDYWALRHPESSSQPKAFLVWAGLEPLAFTNLFPIWTDRDDIAELSIRDGKKPGEILSVENELSRLTRTTYPLEQLKTHPLPEGVDPTRLEEYLAPEEFEKILGMSKEEFVKLAPWKQTSLKKNVGLF